MLGLSLMPGVTVGVMAIETLREAAARSPAAGFGIRLQRQPRQPGACQRQSNTSPPWPHVCHTHTATWQQLARLSSTQGCLQAAAGEQLTVSWQVSKLQDAGPEHVMKYRLTCGGG